MMAVFLVQGSQEAVSWGKVKESAKYVTIDGDATIILPVMFSYLNLF